MPIQHSYIDRVRSLVEQDVRFTASLMYGSFTRGEGDLHSDVEFYLFMPANELTGFDRGSWCERVAPVEYSFVNEFGTFVAVFGGRFASLCASRVLGVGN